LTMALLWADRERTADVAAGRWGNQSEGGKLKRG
jgi:hypothetical protein